jgi:hypothetical protein
MMTAAMMGVVVVKKLLLAGVISLLIVTVARAGDKAKIDKACVREALALLDDKIAAKRICDPKNYVKPPQIGWHCDGGDGSPYKAPGGAKYRRDTLCE